MNQPNQPIPGALETCPGCGGTASPEGAVPYDGTFNTTSGCWATFTEVCGPEFSNAVVFGAVEALVDLQ